MTPIGCFISTLILAATVSNIIPTVSSIDQQFSGNLVSVNDQDDTSKLSSVEHEETVQVRNFIDEIFDFKDQTQVSDEINSNNKVEEARTFGQKRIQFMLLPMMYKMGVMMTLLTVLTVISLKGLMIGIILLVLKLSSFLGKFYSSWNPHTPHGWSPGNSPVHVHLHNNPEHAAHSQAYSGWQSAPEDEHYYYKG